MMISIKISEFLLLQLTSAILQYAQTRLSQVKISSLQGTKIVCISTLS